MIDATKSNELFTNKINLAICYILYTPGREFDFPKNQKRKENEVILYTKYLQ